MQGGLRSVRWMQGVGGSLQCGVRGTVWLWLALLWPICWLRAQEVATPVAPAEAGQPYTLHVYENRIQLPTLVLTSGHESYRGLQAAKFAIQLDGGPKFHPSYVKLEGEDPITLALLLDSRSGEQQDLMRKLSAAVERLPANLLSARDHLSIFAFDCTLVRAVEDQPASAGVWKMGVSEALRAPLLHGPGEKDGHCRQPLHLWDAVATVTGKIGELPGRRVLVVVSDGDDRGSKNSEYAVRNYATGFGLAVFGIRPAQAPRPVVGSSVPNRFMLETSADSPLGTLCAGTGGILIGSTPDALAESLERIVKLLRGRYILEFSRPQNGTAGMHSIDVTTSDISAIVRSSGVSVPVQDKALLNDPQTVPTDTSRNPVLGRGKSTVSKP